MQRMIETGRNHIQNFQTQLVAQAVQMEPGTKGKRNLAPSLVVSAMIGFLACVMPQIAVGQAAPAMIPYQHTIYAGGGGTAYAATAQTGSTTTAVHGTAPGDGGPATAAAVQFAAPTGLATDSLGNLYITDTTGWVRKVDTQGNITTFAGGINYAHSPATTTCPGGTNIIGDGCPANEAYLNTSRGMAIDPATGDIYIAEATGNRIRKINHSTYVITTVVGTSTASTSTKATATTADGDLPSCSTTPGATCSGTIGLLNNPRGIAVDRHGNVYIADDSIFAIRVANFATGKLSTVSNTTFTKGAGSSTCLTITSTQGAPKTAGPANLGAPTDVTFDNAGNLYIADSGCSMIFKVAENPATGMVDAGSTITQLMGTGASTPGETIFTPHPALSIIFTPGTVRADAAGNLYIGENTGNKVWFYDAATLNAHTIFGGGNSGDCNGQAASGTPPYNGCDGPHSVPATPVASGGFNGLAFDLWGNLFIADAKALYVHKLSLGTSAPFMLAVPAGSPNAQIHLSANDLFASVDTTLAPDFTVTVSPQSCTTFSGSTQDNTTDCPAIIANTNASTNPQYEQFKVTSSKGLTSTYQLTNQAYPVCQAATATSQTIGVSGATPVTLSFVPGAGCQGLEGLPVSPHKYSYTVTTPPSHGTLSGTAPSLTYTPTPGYTGVDTFQFTVTDNSAFAGNPVPYDGGANTIVLQAATPLVSSTATVTLKGNTPPVTTGQSVTAGFNTPITITLSATDVDNDPLTYSVAAGPTNGTVSAVSGNTVTYTPTTGYYGSDSFTFKANDGKADSNISTVSITVNPGAPAPVNQPVTVDYQTPTAITLSATGVGPISYAVATQPNHGTLSGTAPNLTYTPTLSYSGSDLFTFTATNSGGSGVGTVNITVSPAPAIPAGQNQSVTVAYNTPKVIMLIAGGGNGNPLTYSVATAPAHGTVSAPGGPNVSYAPAAGYVGADSFTFTASDGTDVSKPATVMVTVTPPPPTATSQSVTTPFGAPVAITLTGTGTGTLNYIVVTSPANGTLTGTAPNLTYTPNTSFSGQDSLTFKVNNGADSNTATVSITVSAPPAPVAISQAVTTTLNVSKAITLTSTGTGTITYAVAAAPTHGTLTGTAPNLTYAPTANYSGADSFTFTASNAGGPSTATVSITVLPAPPVVANQAATAVFKTPTQVTLVASGTGPVTYSIVSTAKNGSVTLNGAVATYTPTTGFAGTDTFTFKANNGSDSNVATVTMTVLPPTPVAASQTLEVPYQTATTVTLSATVTGYAGYTGPLTYQIVTQPSNGKLTGTAPNLTYTPATSFAGTDSFTFTASNNGGPGNLATVTLNVAGGFTWAIASGGSSSMTVKAGQAAVYNLTVAGYTGATGPLTLAVTGAQIFGTVTPNPATLNGTTAIPITVSMNTTTTATAGHAGFVTRYGGRGWPLVLLINAVGLLILLPVSRNKKLRMRIVCALAALSMMAGASGCGNFAQTPFATPLGNYTLTVTATSGTVSSSQTLTLTVTN